MLRNRVGRLYPGHKPTSFMEKIVLASRSAITALMDPKRDDAVSLLAQISNRSMDFDLFSIHFYFEVTHTS